MNIFEINAGGFHSSGLAVVVADTIDQAVQMANDNTDPAYGMTYHPYFVKTLGQMDTDTAHVMAQHEFGFPNFPSKGSGRKVVLSGVTIKF